MQSTPGVCEKSNLHNKKENAAQQKTKHTHTLIRKQQSVHGCHYGRHACI